MFEQLNAWDVALFRWINASFASPLMDDLMTALSNRSTWAIVGVLVVICAVKLRNKRLLHFCITLGLTIGTVDVVTYQVLKPTVARERPCKQFVDIHLVPQWCGGDYGFPSNHAANGMAATVLIAQSYPGPAAWLALCLTLLVGLSRVYMGVHFPGDVAAGFVVGGLLAWLWARAYQWVLQGKVPFTDRQ